MSIKKNYLRYFFLFFCKLYIIILLESNRTIHVDLWNRASFFVVVVLGRNDVMVLNSVRTDLFDCHKDHRLQSYCYYWCYCRHQCVARFYHPKNLSNILNTVDVNEVLLNWRGNLEDPVKNERRKNKNEYLVKRHANINYITCFFLKMFVLMERNRNFSQDAFGFASLKLSIQKQLAKNPLFSLCLSLENVLFPPHNTSHKCATPDSVKITISLEPLLFFISL